MTKTSIAAAVLALASLPLVATAGPAAAHRGQPQAPMAQVNPDAVLYSQVDNDSGIAVVSQNFINNTAYDVYDAQGADDFTVPSGKTWTVNEIDVIGAYFNGSGLAESENVTIYKNKGGKPGKKVKSFMNVAGVDNGTGSFNIKIPKTKLAAGKYFVSVQANLDFAAGGEWGWENQTTSEGFPAQWQNPGDGFATGCVKYSQENVCIVTDPPVGDHMFVVKGKSS